MAFEDDEEALRRSRLDAELDQEEAESRERAKENPGTLQVKISELARRSWMKIVSMSPEEWEQEWERKYQHILKRLHALAQSNDPLLCANLLMLEQGSGRDLCHCPVVIRFPDGEILEWFTIYTPSFWAQQEEMRQRRSPSTAEEDPPWKGVQEEGVSRFRVNLQAEKVTMVELQKAAQMWFEEHFPDEPHPRIEWLPERRAGELVSLHLAQQAGFATHAEYEAFLNQELLEWAELDVEMGEPQKHSIFRVYARMRELFRSLMCILRR